MLKPRVCIALFVIQLTLSGQRPVKCQNGEIHIPIDFAKLAIAYKGDSLRLTLSGLNALGARVVAEPKTLQLAAAATQQWNEMLKGLVLGYNTCAVSRQQYNEGLRRIYPRLKSDGGDLETFRQALIDGEKVNMEELRKVLATYLKDLRAFARISKSQIVDATRAAVDASTDIILDGERASEQRIIANQEQSNERTLAALARVQEIVRGIKSPSEVEKAIGSLRGDLLAKADEAEREYTLGYELTQQYRFKESISHFRAALDAVPLPVFYVTLVAVLQVVPDLTGAELVAREGLTHSAGKPESEAALNNSLSQVLREKGNLDAAQVLAERALKFAESAYGTNDPFVAVASGNLGAILADKGILDEAQSFTERALRIDEKVYGASHMSVAVDANNLAVVLKARGDLNGAQKFSERALRIDETNLGPDSPSVARDETNLGQILEAKGDLKAAQDYCAQALRVAEKIYGPYHPAVAINATNLSQILQDKGDLDGAQELAERALRIDTKIYESDHPSIARDDNNLALILKDKGQIERARSFAVEALRIDEKVYGANQPIVAIAAGNLALILRDTGDLDGAQLFAERALRIDKEIYEPEHPAIARDYNNLALILKARGHLGEAYSLAAEAVRIDEKVYGPDHFNVAIAANTLGLILQEKGDLYGARYCLRQAVDIAVKCFGPNAEVTKRFTRELSNVEDTQK